MANSSTVNSGDLATADQYNDLRADVLDSSTGHNHDGSDGNANIEPDNIQFPATQVPSADGNNLDDYEEGTWTPVLTFTTPGNLSVAYSARTGVYTKIGRLVTIAFYINTSTFTHSTASGNMQITGLPFTSANVANQFMTGALHWAGITKTNYTAISLRLSLNSAILTAEASGSGQASSGINAADMPSGGSVELRGAISYVV